MRKKKRYFEFVDRTMKELYPASSDEERTKKARELFFDANVKYMKQNPEVKNKEVVDYFQSIKDKYQLALITTNTKSALKRILNVTGLENMFDLIETSKAEEKDDKKIVFERFIEKYGKPIVYIGGGRKDSYNYCKEYDIKRIFANFDGEEELEEVENVHNLDELKEEIKNFISIRFFTVSIEIILIIVTIIPLDFKTRSIIFYYPNMPQITFNFIGFINLFPVLIFESGELLFCSSFAGNITNVKNF